MSQIALAALVEFRNFQKNLMQLIPNSTQTRAILFTNYGIQ